jgi:hypothetical protein
MRSIPSGLLTLAIATVLCVMPGPSASQNAGTVLRLRVRPTIGSSPKALSRKRFYLIKGSLEQNKSVVDTIERRPVVSRECYFRSAGASEALIKWLKDNDCESVYCREIQLDDLTGDKAVPEFVNALAAGEKELGSRELARKWLTVNLPEKIRSGFYRERQNELQASLKQAEESSGARVLSVMTDRNGTAYFTDLEPGTYLLSNIVPTEVGSSSLLWNCEVQVKQDDRGYEKPYLLSNRKDKTVKCVAVEKPLPACETGPK